ncbi:MAG: hypothetical protein H6845_01825 [Alphaproteobacteria bacterium]|nr:MAG: hypothetical protein H6845_01825 [Alphaproteobacteria bacterium]
MLVTIATGAKEILYEDAIMVGISTYAGLKAIYQFHVGITYVLPACQLFIHLGSKDVTHNIGASMLKKIKENVYIITNTLDYSSKIKLHAIQNWNKIVADYYNNWNKENWFKNNSHKIDI